MNTTALTHTPVRAPAGAPSSQAPPAAVSAVRSLYLHIPFCERKCEYCDFASVAGLRGHERYVGALRAEIRRTGEALAGCEIDTVFVGGGTPGLLPPALLAGVLEEVRASFRVAGGAEVTVEANPSSTTEERATAWLEAGVTRVSLGVQALDDDVLRFLGRVHDGARALAAVAAVQRAGFVSVNCDLIYAVPGLDDRCWGRTLDRILDLDCGHLSCYELTVEEGTPLHTAVAAGRTRVVDADTALRQHWAAVERAAGAGYAQYEVSNLARPGRECRHNLAYWADAFYAACGTGAHGHLPPAAAAALGLGEASEAGCVAVRYHHPRDPGAYADLVERGGVGAAGAEAVDAAGAEAERLMVGLRRARGVEVRHAAGREQAALLAGAGLVTWDGTTVRATRRGQEVLNRVALRLVEGL